MRNPMPSFTHTCQGQASAAMRAWPSGRQQACMSCTDWSRANPPRKPMAAPRTAYVLTRPAWNIRCRGHMRPPCRAWARPKEATTGPHMPAQCPTEPRSPAIHMITSQGRAWDWLSQVSSTFHLCRDSTGGGPPRVRLSLGHDH